VWAHNQVKESQKKSGVNWARLTILDNGVIIFSHDCVQGLIFFLDFQICPRLVIFKLEMA